MKDKILCGLILNTKDSIIRKRNEVSYHITGLKALNLSTLTFENFSWYVRGYIIFAVFLVYSKIYQKICISIKSLFISVIYMI